MDVHIKKYVWLEAFLIPEEEGILHIVSREWWTPSTKHIPE